MKANKGLLNSSLANKSVVERVVDQITAAIISGELKPGDKIPTELELSQSFEVGRNSVREAIKVLTSFGVLRVKRSEGTFVCEGFNNKMLDPMLYGLILQRDSTRELTELRRVFDMGVLQVAMEKADEKNIQQLHQSLEALEQQTMDENCTPEDVLEVDRAFHQVILECTGNTLIASTADYIDRITIPSRKRTMHTIFATNQRERFVELHRQMLDIIEHRQPQFIADTVKEHYYFWKKETGSEDADSDGET